MQTVQVALWVVMMLVVLAFLFDFMNGFHDAANSIATVVCLCRLNIDPPCRLNIDPGLVANFRIGNCG